MSVCGDANTSLRQVTHELESISNTSNSLTMFCGRRKRELSLSHTHPHHTHTGTYHMVQLLVNVVLSESMSDMRRTRRGCVCGWGRGVCGWGKGRRVLWMGEGCVCGWVRGVCGWGRGKESYVDG